MSTKLYVGKDCHDCEKVVDYLAKHGKEAEVIDVDEQNLDLDIFIRPALFVNEELMAYGVDIIDYFEKKG